MKKSVRIRNIRMLLTDCVPRSSNVRKCVSQSLKVGEDFFQKLVFLACLSKWCCSELFSYLLKAKLAMATGADQVKALHEAGLFPSSKLLVRSSVLTCKYCYFPSRSAAHSGKMPPNLRSTMLWFIGPPLTAAYKPLTGSRAYVTVPDPDLEITVGGWGWGPSPNNIFSAFRASVWSKKKIRGGPPLDPPLY